MKIHPNSEEHLTALMDMDHLQKIQDLFANVIKAPIRVVDIQGRHVTSLSAPAPICKTIRSSSLFGLDHCKECIIKGLKQFLENQDEVYECVFGLKHFFIPIVIDEGAVIGFVVLGPILIGKRKLSHEFDEELLRSFGIDSQMLADMLRDVTIFSYKGIEAINALLRDAVHYMVELAHHKNKLQNWLPGFLNVSYNRKNSNYIMLYKNRLLNVLLEIALDLTKADTGSVLLYDKKEKRLDMKIAYGLNDRFVNQYSVDPNESLAGHVFKTAKSMLVGNNEDHHVSVSRLLMRDEVKSSFVVPLKAYNDTFGVLCVTSFKENKKFNKNTLKLLDKLGELSGVAVAGFQM
ncbi:PocR ligand-binding domain-containing protein [Candidatus Omnitrophota bacterium]